MNKCFYAFIVGFILMNVFLIVREQIISIETYNQAMSKCLKVQTVNYCFDTIKIK